MLQMRRFLKLLPRCSKAFHDEAHGVDGTKTAPRVPWDSWHWESADIEEELTIISVVDLVEIERWKENLICEDRFNRRREDVV